MKYYSLDVEYTNYSKRFSPFSDDKLLTIGAYDGKNKLFWNIFHPDAPMDEIANLHKIISDPDIVLIGHNLKSDILWIEVVLGDYSPIEDWTVKCKIFDTMNFTDTYCLIDRETEQNKLEYLVMKYLKRPAWKGMINIKKLDKEPLEKVKDYNLFDVVNNYDLAMLYMKKFQKPANSPEGVILEFQRKCIRTLINMEKRGVLIDPVKAYIAGKEIMHEIETLQATVNKIAKREVYIESPKDLPKLLYEDLKLPVLMVSETTGNPSADVDALNELRYYVNTHNGLHNTKEGQQQLELFEAIKKYRKNKKLFTTFLQKIPEYIKYDGRIHSRFNVGKGFGVDPKHEKGTGSGRLSSDSPNVQQIPAQDLIRNIYIASPYKVLLDPDYSQLELVVCAFVANETNMIQTIKEGKDIHTFTTAMIDGVSYEEVKEAIDNSKHPLHKEYTFKRWMRKRSGFGILFGMGAYHFTQLLKYEGTDISMAEAKMWIDEWLDLYPKVRELKAITEREAREQGYVRTIFGHKIMTPYAKEGTNKEMVARNYRQAFNGKIQSPAAYICLSAMLLIDKESPDILLIQVHDSLPSEEHYLKADETKKRIKEIMTVDTVAYLKKTFNVDFNVPLTVKIKDSREWKA